MTFNEKINYIFVILGNYDKKNKSIKENINIKFI